MTKRSVKARPKLATLAELRTACRDAPVVWLALCELAAERGSNYVTPTRAKLSEMTGVTRLKNISAGLTALHRAGWIQRELIPVTAGGRQTARLLRIVLCKVPHSGTASGVRKGRQVALTYETPVKGGRRPYAKGRQVAFDFLKEGERCDMLRNRPPQDIERETEPPAESTIARLEREAMERIRAARLAGIA